MFWFKREDRQKLQLCMDTEFIDPIEFVQIWYSEKYSHIVCAETKLTVLNVTR